MLMQCKVAREISKRFLFSVVLRQRDPKRQLIICGYPRSGTSMLYNMIASTLKQFDIASGEKTALKTIWKYGDWAAKCPHDILKLYNRKIEQLNIHQKELLVLVVVRDIRDVITSKHQWAPDDYMMGYESSITITGDYPNYVRRFNGPGIKKYFRAIKDIQNSKGLKVVVFKYEELVSDPDKYQNILREKFDLDFDGKFSQYHRHQERHKLRYEGSDAPIDKELKKSSSQVSTNFVNRWQVPEHYERITQQFQDHPDLFEILKEHGYETSPGWYEDYKKTKH